MKWESFKFQDKDMIEDNVLISFYLTDLRKEFSLSNTKLSIRFFKYR